VPPFPQGTALEKVLAHREKAPHPLKELCDDLPPGFDDMLNRMLAKRPSERYKTPAEVAAALEPFCQPVIEVSEADLLPASPPRRARLRPWLMLAAAALLAAVAFAGYQYGLNLFRGATEHGIAGNEKPDDPRQREAEQLAREVRARLTTYCYRCHGQDGAIEGGFNYLLDREQLVARRKIVPGQPAKSRLLRRVVEGEMPPAEETLRPGKDDIALFERWIEAGAPAFDRAPAQSSFITVADVLASICADLEKRNERDRPFMRYMMLTHLHNAGLSADELQTYRNGVAKLLNSLSWNKTIVVPTPIDAERTVLRIDLRDYKWSRDRWDALLRPYPYAVQYDSQALAYCTEATGCAMPLVRGDWFVALAARPPLYHDLLELPRNALALEKQLHVDVAENIRGERVARAGFSKSGVSRNNRLIERHETAYGAYWKSYDFKKDIGEENLFEQPLGPGNDARSFRPAGGEIIFNLPNGLQAYMLVNGQGERIDTAPTEIVSDPKRPNRAVENGLSCMSCHSRGINPKDDQIRAHVQSSGNAFDKIEAGIILALYPPREVFAKLLEEDAERFQKAAAATGAKAGATEPIMALAAQFEAPLNLRRAAAEIGLRPDEFLARLEQSPELARTIGALKPPDGDVQRETFELVFPQMTEKWQLGRPLARTSVAAAPLPAARKEAVAPSPRPILRRPPIAFQVHVPTTDREQVPLAGPVADVAVGGGGRYLILRLAGKKKLAVFDVQLGKVAKELPLSEEVVHFAAGANRLVVVNPNAKVIQLWSLTTLERERSGLLPATLSSDSIHQICMGSASAGPLFVYLPKEKRTLALNLDSMETIEVTWSHWGPRNAYGPLNMRASPDGTLLAGWGGGWAGLGVATFSDGIQTGTHENLPFWAHDRAFALPSADARFIYIPEGVANRGFSLYKAPDGFLVPSVEPGFFVAIVAPPPRTKGAAETTVYTDDRKLLFFLKGLDELRAGVDLPWEKRVYYYPRAGLLVTLSAEKDRLILRKVDLADQLEKSGADYLVVLSKPPMAKAGATFAYQLDIRAKKGGAKVKLESGPEGLNVTPDGRVTWNVPAVPAEPEVEVLITISDASGQETQHRFTVQIDSR
jgi:hypothetical protein